MYVNGRINLFTAKVYRARRYYMRFRSGTMHHHRHRRNALKYYPKRRNPAYIYRCGAHLKLCERIMTSR